MEVSLRNGESSVLIVVQNFGPKAAMVTMFFLGLFAVLFNWRYLRPSEHIINHRENIYKCKYCKDNADISAVPTSWTSKLFMQEMESTNVGIRRIPRPFVFESVAKEKPMIDEYNDTTVKQLARMVEDMVEDTGVSIDHD